MPAFDALGVRVYALSYDEQDALADFASAHHISYRLLSDPKSAVIRQFGILNTIIAEDDHPWYGIPYPGTYVLNDRGVITHKFFENNLAVRAGPEQLLNAIRGEHVALEPNPPTASDPAAVTADVFLDGDTLALSVQRDLVARLQVPAGSHLYADPAPTGMVAVDMALDANPRLVLRDLVRPASEKHSLADTSETFEVHNGTVELRLPITVNGAVTTEDNARELVLSGTVRWQSCNDEVCELPVTHRFEMTVPVDKPVLPQIQVRDKARTREPRAAEHFQQLVHRHKQP